MTLNDSQLRFQQQFDVEYCRNDKRPTCGYGYYRPLIESGMWPIELCHRQ